MEKKRAKKSKILILFVKYEFQPSNLRVCGPFLYIKVPQLKHFSSYFGKSCTGFNVLKI